MFVQAGIKYSPPPIIYWDFTQCLDKTNIYYIEWMAIERILFDY